MSGLTLLYFLILITSLLLGSSVNAVCPVCTVAVVAGLGLSRWLGIDDLISGVWIGGLIISLIIWSLSWLNELLRRRAAKYPYRRVLSADVSSPQSGEVSMFRNKKQIKFKLSWLAVSIIFYSITIIPLYFSGIIGHPLNKFYGIDRILFGIVSGSLAFLLSFWLNNFLKKKNQGKVFFPFQKVVLPILFLIIASLIFYFIQ